MFNAFVTTSLTDKSINFRAHTQSVFQKVTDHAFRLVFCYKTVEYGCGGFQVSNKTSCKNIVVEDTKSPPHMLYYSTDVEKTGEGNGCI